MVSEEDLFCDEDEQEGEHDLITCLELLQGAVKSLPLEHGPTGLRLARRALELGEFLGSDLTDVFGNLLLWRNDDEADASFAFTSLASLGFNCSAPGMSGSVGLNVLSFPDGLRAYFANDGDGHRLVGGAVSKPRENTSELDAGFLSAALDSNGDRFGLPLIATVPDDLALDESFSFDFWLERFERCFSAASKYDPDWRVLGELAVLGLEEEVRRRAYTPHVRDGLLAALEHGGVEAMDELPTRTQIALWLGRVWLREN